MWRNKKWRLERDLQNLLDELEEAQTYYPYVATVVRERLSEVRETRNPSSMMRERFESVKMLDGFPI